MHGNIIPPYVRAFLLGLILWVALVHVSGFFAAHVESDEQVYMALSQKLSWSLDHYTTRDVRGLNQFSIRVYREPLFYHPPLFPMIIAGLAHFGGRIEMTLGFNLFLQCSIILLVFYGVHALSKDLGAAMTAAWLPAVCPILTYSSMKVHMDILVGFLCLVCTLCLAGAGLRKSWPMLFGGAIAFGLALTTKLTLVAIVPFYAIAVWITLDGFQLSLRKKMGGFLFLLVIPLALFAPYLAKYLQTYGFLSPSELLVHTGTPSPFLQRIMARTRPEYAVSLALLVPALLTPLITPCRQAYIALFREWPELKGPAIITVGNIAVCWFFRDKMERYWALALPSFYFYVGLMVSRLPKSVRLNLAPIFFFLTLTQLASVYARMFQPTMDLILPGPLLMLSSWLDRYF